MGFVWALLVLGLASITSPVYAADLSYTYDANGNVQTKTSPSGTATFTYDPLDRLNTEAGPQGNRDHAYDPNGNRTGNGAGFSASYAPNSDRLVLVNGFLVTLDPVGNLTADDRFRYTWDALNQLKEVRRFDNTLIATYYYDWRGLRTRKVTTAAAPQGAGKTFYHYDFNDHLIAETGPGKTPLVTYVWWDDTLTGVIVHQPSRTVYTVETDALGSPFQVRTFSGQVVWRWESEGYGGTPPDVDGDGNRFTLNVRFPGQYFDLESDLHYNHHRYYNPRLGRYMSADPIGVAGSLNLYGYARLNPLRWVDPLGLAIGDFPPPPPGYDPRTWPTSQWDDGRWFVKDPRNKVTYTCHPEDKGHWRHWDKDGDDNGRWPPKSKKPWPGQKKPPYGDQSASDPSGDAPPWQPPTEFSNFPGVPFVPVPSGPLPSMPPVRVPFPMVPVFVP